MEIKQNKIIAFIGTYTKNKSRGIYKIIFNSSSGCIEEINLAYEIENPTYLSIDKERHIIYSACKIGEKAGVASFKYLHGENHLNLINYMLLEEKQPCHISINNHKQLLISSNYHENKMLVYNTLDGLILNSPMAGSHSGSSINTSRQEKPHIHCSILTEDERYILSIDLGIDKMIISTIEDNVLIQKNDISFSFPPGSGPRHITYLKSNPFYYVLSELTSEIFVLKYNCDVKVPFENIQTLSSLPKNYTGEKSGAAIRVHKNNRFLYTSDRGNNSISLFLINTSDGKLEFIDTYSCEGNSPRDFQLDPTGNFLLCANENSDNISIFSINQETGILSFIKSEHIPTPTSIEFI
ncbi:MULTISPECIES: beta-propeller fold lactonase family protein [unclassified Clostridium]|uniref:lactonase family protein n=1 Tax=unclassified Clostridium TaxID=2614128 RepID=UPI0002986728|nr:MULTISPECIES: beta-propeller fold lactonase family protein [unclassified Clostridium]EKQ53419.1 MAG: 3-carboxymuconate cyclase [Clostridium sp. Maddingley MBC34-26]